MCEFIKVMAVLSRRLSSGNETPVESTRITKEEFEVICEEIERMEEGLEYSYKVLDLLQDLPIDINDILEA